MTIQALVTRKVDGKTASSIEAFDEAALGEGDVTVAIEWSTVNYKDGLALAGAHIMQSYPLIGGIDFAGTVERSDHPDLRPGDRVLANSWGLSQTHNGGYAQKARVPREWLIRVPERFTTRDAMAIGTAGYTAMLCVLGLEHGGITPGRGDILVTGASGGVGSIAIALLSSLGYRVVASTGRQEEAGYLTALGAADIIDRQTLSEPGKPVAAARWAGVVDSVGSHTLANVIAQTQYCGVVTACGLAQGTDLPSSVLPFILRNVTLAGIDSVNTPVAVREQAWTRLARDLDLGKLASTTVEAGLDKVPELARRILKGQVRGRTVVKVGA